MKAIYAALLKFPGLVLNGLFLLYFTFLGPAVLNRLERVIDHGARDPLLAVLFLSAPFIEMAGFILVTPSLLDRLAQAPRQPSSLPALVWMAHLILNIVLLLNGFACIGFDTRNGPPLLGIILLAAMVIKELWYLLYWVFQADPKRLASLAHQHFRRPRLESPSSQFLAWLLLAPFAALSFTGFWGLLVARNPIHYSQPGGAVVELALAVFVFLVIFAGARSIYLIEEWAFLRGRGPVLAWAGTLLLNLLVALAGLPRA
jgi:hypothetical protein